MDQEWGLHSKHRLMGVMRRVLLYWYHYMYVSLSLLPSPLSCMIISLLSVSLLLPPSSDAGVTCAFLSPLFSSSPAVLALRLFARHVFVAFIVRDFFPFFAFLSCYVIRFGDLNGLIAGVSLSLVDYPFLLLHWYSFIVHAANICSLSSQPWKMTPPFEQRGRGGESERPLWLPDGANHEVCMYIIRSS